MTFIFSVRPKVVFFQAAKAPNLTAALRRKAQVTVSVRKPRLPGKLEEDKINHQVLVLLANGPAAKHSSNNTALLTPVSSATFPQYYELLLRSTGDYNPPPISAPLPRGKDSRRQNPAAFHPPAKAISMGRGFARNGFIHQHSFHFTQTKRYRGNHRLPYRDFLRIRLQPCQVN